MNFSTFKRLKVFSFMKSFKERYNRTHLANKNSRYCCQAPESTCGFIWVSWKKNLKSNLLVVNSYLNWYILTKTRLMRTYIIVVSNWRLRLEGQVWNIPLISPCIFHSLRAGTTHVMASGKVWLNKKEKTTLIKRRVWKVFVDK